MKTVLCYGDSNTWGSATAPRPDDRYPPDERWTGILRRRLGPEWLVVEEGLPGRTTVHPDPIEGSWLDGSAYLLPCLRSHQPLDAIVLMLGTNDLKARFNVPAGEAQAGFTLAATLGIAEGATAGVLEGATGAEPRSAPAVTTRATATGTTGSEDAIARTGTVGTARRRTAVIARRRTSGMARTRTARRNSSAGRTTTARIARR